MPVQLEEADSVVAKVHLFEFAGKSYEVKDPSWATLCDAQEAFERARGSMRGTICYAYAVARTCPSFRGDYKTLDDFMARGTGMSTFKRCIEPFVVSVMGAPAEGEEAAKSADDFPATDGADSGEPG